MNCKPGDLVVVIRRSHPIIHLDDIFIGEVRRVVRLIDTNIWEYEGTRLVCPVRGEVIGLHDRALLALRDPGDDAVDEVLQRLPVPHKEMA